MLGKVVGWPSTTGLAGCGSGLGVVEGGSTHTHEVAETDKRLQA